MLYVILWLGLCFFVVGFAKNRKMGSAQAFVISLLLSPVVGIIVAALSPEVEKKPKEQSPDSTISTTEELYTQDPAWPDALKKKIADLEEEFDRGMISEAGFRKRRTHLIKKAEE
jgi:hypothetical protein